MLGQSRALFLESLLLPSFYISLIHHLARDPYACQTTYTDPSIISYQRSAKESPYGPLSARFQSQRLSALFLYYYDLRS